MPYEFGKKSQSKFRRLKLCIVGMSGHGKSSLGNILLGLNHDDENGFRTSEGAGACTIDVRAIDGLWRGNPERPVRIIDTPGYGDKDYNKEVIDRFVEDLKAEGTVDAFIWVKNSQEPRFTHQEDQYLSILFKVFGSAFLKSMAVVFSRWSFNEKDERKRKARTFPVTLDGVKGSFFSSLFQVDSEEVMPNEMPMLAVDALHDRSDVKEVEAFGREVELLWHALVLLDSVPVVDSKAAYSDIDTLRKMLEDTQAMLAVFKDDLQCLRKYNQELEDRLKELESRKRCVFL